MCVCVWQVCVLTGTRGTPRTRSATRRKPWTAPSSGLTCRRSVLEYATEAMAQWLSTAPLLPRCHTIRHHSFRYRHLTRQHCSLRRLPTCQHSLPHPTRRFNSETVSLSMSRCTMSACYVGFYDHASGLTNSTAKCCSNRGAVFASPLCT